MRELGSTGLRVSRLGLGLAALGRPGYINLGHAADLGASYDPRVMERGAHAVLDAAWGAGVRYFDAARSYGRAEEFLGSWLDARGASAAEAIVGSKWGYTYTAGWRVDAEAHEVKEHKRAVLTRQIGESRGWLGDRLRLYQIHSATLESGVLDRSDVLTELGRLRESGLSIGLSLSGARQGETLERAMSVRVEGVRLFDCVQATWNVLEPSAQDALSTAHEEGLGVIVKEGVANGRLTARNDDPAFAVKRSLLDGIASRIGVTIDALSLAAILAQPWADVVLSGAATVGHLRSNLASLTVALDEADRASLATLVEPPEAYWAFRSRLPWN